MPKSVFYEGKQTSGFIYIPTESDHPGSIGYHSAMSEFDKMLHDGIKIPEHVYFEVPKLIGLWKEKKNPHFIDTAIWICSENEFEPTKYLLQQATEASIMRLHGDPKAAAKPTALAVKNESSAFQVFSWMAHFCATGLSVEDASKKAAMLFKINFPELAIRKASGLSKQYKPKMKEYGLFSIPLDEVVKKMHEREQGLSAKWREIADSTPECDYELLGNRRNFRDLD